MTDKKLPNVLLCVSVFQTLAESNWRHEAYKKLRYLLKKKKISFKSFSFFVFYCYYFFSFYILCCIFYQPVKNPMYPISNIVLNISFDKCKRLFLNAEYDQGRNQVSLKLPNLFVSSFRMLWYFIKKVSICRLNIAPE